MNTLTGVRARGAAVLLVTFVSGILLGTGLENWRSGRWRRPPPTRSAAPPEQIVENMKMARSGIPLVYEALQLTPEQRLQIAQIMEASRPTTDSLLRDTWPRLRALLDSLQRQVEQVLTPQQRGRLAALRGTVAPGFDLKSLPNEGKRP